jgi:hypothetical protein
MTGLPTVVGKTPYASIALTTIYSDSQDLYKESIKGDNYVIDGKEMRLK